MNLADKITKAKKTLDERSERVREQVSALDEARREEAAAEQRYDATGKDAELEALTKMRLRSERAVRLLATERSQETMARHALDALEREGKAALLRAKMGRAKGWPAEIAGEVQELDAKDREIVAISERIAEKLLACEGAYREAQALAKELGLEDEFDREAIKPSVKKARYLANVAVQRARFAASRTSGADWIAGVEMPDWKSSEREPYEAAIALLSATKGS